MIKINAIKKAELNKQIKEKEMADMVQAYLDSKAKLYGYDDIKSAVSYADEPSVARFQIHGLAFRAWRSLVWEKCYEVLAKVEAGMITKPSGEELLAMLPTLSLEV